MCGICGQVSVKGRGIAPEVIRRMSDVLRHRGPDDNGFVFIPPVENPADIRRITLSTWTDHILAQDYVVAMGHRRLSIIDLSQAAHQPMCNEDGTVWIVYNGEIYNFQDLRRRLEAMGHSFRSQSDTEVVIHAYEQWGTDCLHRFRGMFAFGLWDHRQRRLFLARDRLGQKPLCYHQRDGVLIFASEIKSILQDPLVERQVDHTALHDYLAYQYIPAPKTIFAGIRKLPPAHYLLFDATGQISITKYWTLSYRSREPKDEISHGARCDKVRHILREAVKIRLISDVPLGAFLSGGLDSSATVAMMAHLLDQPVKTFSIGFHEKTYDELAYARQVARQFGTEHREFIVEPQVMEILPKLIWYYNEPFADSSAIPTYYVAEQTGHHVKVVLTGDGGDENFAGYNRYVRQRVIDGLSRIPPPLRGTWMVHLLRRMPSPPSRPDFFANLARLMSALSDSAGRNYGLQMLVFDKTERTRLYAEAFKSSVDEVDPLDFFHEKFQESDGKGPVERMLSTDVASYLPDCLLVKMDIATMANSLEARSPFLDHELMECLASMPARVKLRASTTKYLLKEALKGFVPEEILKRPKMGFGVPIDHWFRHELRGYIYDVLLDDAALRRGYFRKEGIEEILDEHIRLGFNHSARIWALLNLELWHRIFIDAEVKGRCQNSLP